MRLARRLLGCLSLEWITDLVNLIHALRQFASGHAPGLYEILEYDTTLEVSDRRGLKAVFRKHQRVKFLQNNVIAFQDYAWGEGEIFADYSCKPGVVVDRYQEGDRWNVLVSLRATKQRGDVEDFYIERTVKNGFLKKEEWCQVEIRHPTRKLRIAVILPKSRHSHRSQITQRSRHRTTSLGPDHVDELADGRQMLWWEATNLRPLEIFTLKWRW
jgi:hypothetical protein